MKTSRRLMIVIALLAFYSPAGRPQQGSGFQERYPPDITDRHYPENANSYVTDLRPVLGELATLYPEHRSQILKSAQKQTVVTRVQVELLRILTDNDREIAGVNSTASIKLYDSLKAAESGFRATLKRLPVRFDRFPKERGALGEIAVISTDRQGSGVILVRRNAVVWVIAEAPYRHWKADRSTRLLPDVALEERAITLARTLDQLLIAAK